MNWRRGPLAANSLYTHEPAYHVILDRGHFDIDSEYASTGIREGWLTLFDYKCNAHGETTNYYTVTGE